MITKPQLELLCKWAKSSRLIVQPVMPPEVMPEWARHEYRLARLCVALMRDGMKWRDEQAAKAARSAVSRGTLLSVLSKIEEKSSRKSESYREGARKGAATRKRQVAARAAAEGKRDAA